MANSHHQSGGPEGFGSASGAEDPGSSPLWWHLTWSGWGLFVAATVLWFDGNTITAALWLIVGLLIGMWLIPILTPFSTPVFQWFENVSSDSKQRHQLCELAMRNLTETEEFNRLIENDCYDAVLSIAPLAGPCFGLFWGGIGGVLCKLDASIGITASQCALYGIGLGVVAAPFILAMVLAVLIPADETPQFFTRCRRRAMLIASPVLLLPLSLHCAKWISKSLCKGVG